MTLRANNTLSSPLTILVFSTHFFPHIGGVETFNKQLWPHFIEQGWNVRLVTCNVLNSAQSECIDGIQVNRLRCINLLRGQWPIPVWLTNREVWQRALFPMASRMCVVTNTRFYFLSVIATRVAKKYGLPHIHIEHGSSWRVSESPVVNIACALFDRLFGTCVIRSASRCVAISQAAAEYCRHLGATGVEVVYNGVDTMRFSSAVRNPQQWDIDEHKLIFLFAGRLIEPKGIRVFLEAAQTANISNAAYVIAGDGPLRNYVVEVAKTNPQIRFLGPVPGDNMPALYRCAHVFCHPSWYAEGLPTAILEAGAAGCAVIATSAGGTPDIISDGQFGIIIPEKSPEDLCAAMRTLANDSDLRQRLARALQLHITCVFDISIAAGRMKYIIEDLISMPTA